MQWVNQFTSTEALEAAKARWSQKLGNLSRAEIKRGLDEMGQHYKRFPPNLNEFIDLCKGLGPLRGANKGHHTWLGWEPSKKSSRATGKAKLREIKQVIGNNS